MSCPEICTLKSVPLSCCMKWSVWPNNEKNTQNSLENCVNVALIFVPSSPYCIDCKDPYTTTSNIRKITQHSNINVSLGFVPNISWEMCHLCCPNFPLSSLLENLSQSPLMSCTLPNAFFYKIWRWPFTSQVSFHLPPTLNPKAKISSFLYKIKGHDSSPPK